MESRDIQVDMMYVWIQFRWCWKDDKVEEVWLRLHTRLCLWIQSNEVMLVGKARNKWVIGEHKDSDSSLARDMLPAYTQKSSPQS